MSRQRLRVHERPEIHRSIPYHSRWVTIPPAMPRSAERQTLAGLASRMSAFVAERHPLALDAALAAMDAAMRGARDAGGAGGNAAGLEQLRPIFRRELTARLHAIAVGSDLPDPTPGTSAGTRLDQARDEVLEACDGFFSRAALALSLTPAERVEILRGMVDRKSVV